MSKQSPDLEESPDERQFFQKRRKKPDLDVEYDPAGWVVSATYSELQNWDLELVAVC